MQELQGADTSQAVDETLYGTTAEIETIMEQVERQIISELPQQAQDILLRGKIECHKVIESVQDTTQTVVDYGQGFIGIVNIPTFKIGTTELLPTEDGISDWAIDGSNVLTISATLSRGDTLYSYYSVDPDTIVLPQLARLLIKMCSIVLGRREIFGGSGDDSGLSDTAETIAVEISEMLGSFKDQTSISGLMEMNLCNPVTASDVMKVRKTCRTS
jgi:hypothetical protein